jgi:hypothetical protein
MKRLAVRLGLMPAIVQGMLEQDYVGPAPGLFVAVDGTEEVVKHYGRMSADLQV